MKTNSPITFGKFNGWTPADLAAAGEVGRSYLSWGATNLKSPQWRQAFEAALAAPFATDMYKAARALMVGDSELGIDEAMHIVADEDAWRKEQDAWFAAFQAARRAVAEEWAPRMGKSAAELDAIAHRFETTDWWDIPADRFSSAAARERFMDFMAIYTKAEVPAP